jgi:uncharacterized protein (TIGR00159 family)
MLSFLDIRFVDIIDILLCAYIMFLVYRLIKGTVALNIIVSIFGILALWLIVRALKMSMMTAIFDSFINIGLLALIIIFQQEVRRFLVMASTRYDIVKRFGLERVFMKNEKMAHVETIIAACNNMSESKTGALIILSRKVGLKEYVSTGIEINSDYSQQIIESIFFKNTPLHDGAMIADKQKILAAACILPVSQNMDIPKNFGLRHRSALGITESTDAIAIVVSEETGNITYFDRGVYIKVNKAQDLKELLEKI